MQASWNPCLLGMLPSLTVFQGKSQWRLVTAHLGAYRALACWCVWTWVTDCRLEAWCVRCGIYAWCLRHTDPWLSPCHLQMLTACSWHSSKGNIRVTCQKKKFTLILQVTEPGRWQSSHSLPLGHPPSVPPLEANLQWFATFTKKGPSVLLSSDLLILVPTPVPKFPTLLVFFLPGKVIWPFPSD